jgi:hypothetical protein
MSVPMNYPDGNAASHGHLDQLFDELSKIEKSEPQDRRRR